MFEFFKQERQNSVQENPVTDRETLLDISIKEKISKLQELRLKDIETDLALWENKRKSLPSIRFSDSSMPNSESICQVSFTNFDSGKINIELDAPSIFYNTMMAKMYNKEVLNGEYWFGSNERNPIKFNGTITNISYLNGNIHISITGEIIR